MNHIYRIEKQKKEDNWNLKKSVIIYNQTRYLCKTIFFPDKQMLFLSTWFLNYLHKPYKIHNLQDLTSIRVSGFFPDVIKHATTFKTLRQFDNLTHIQYLFLLLSTNFKNHLKISTINSDNVFLCWRGSLSGFIPMQVNKRHEQCLQWDQVILWDALLRVNATWKSTTRLNSSGLTVNLEQEFAHMWYISM